MNWKRGLGIGFLFAGGFIILTARTLTGAVVGTAKENYLGLFGVLLLVSGIVLLFVGTRVKGEYRVRDLDDIIEETGTDEDVVFVLDSSGAIDYKKDVEKILSQYPGRTYVPKRVIGELKKNKVLMNKFKDKYRHLRVKQLSPKKDSGKYKTLRRFARENLRETKKHQDYLVMRKMVEEEKVPAGVSDRELERYEEKIEFELEEKLREQRDKHRREPTKENKIWLLKKEYRVSKGDIDVLTTALKNAGLKKRTKVLAFDTHIRDAIASIRMKYPQLRDYLEYIDYREYENSEEYEEAA